ncbi:A-kinase anchor protein 10, mitochondrial-like [Xenia sp. Carnegie-2017]|uniref:A-kinase anchor protein 10, mitochondrial-like n=1 Tax=Xenia sp. Carnegie-2017 TaxID=2897299 RepID=UPI001F03D418|nr:A-kinase anchor protein 10, mitochondrial-like [Xenia sp. Carnegie-2017]
MRLYSLEPVQMPFFSKRKSGKRKSNVSFNGSKFANVNSLHQKQLPSSETNDILPNADAEKKNLLKLAKRSSNSSTKCVANFPRRSRLSKTLPEVVVDDTILPLFLEFLQKQGAQKFLNFWLAAETFRLSGQKEKTVEKSAFQSSRFSEYVSNSKASVSQSNHPNMGIVHCSSKDLSRSNEMDVNKRLQDSLLPIGTDSDNKTDNVGSSEEFCSKQENGKILNSSHNIPDASCVINNVVDIRTSSDKFKTVCDQNLRENDSFELSTKDLQTSQESTDKQERSTFSDGLSKVMIEDALNIYHHFIALDASHSLNVDETMRREIERRICTEDGSVDADCFHVAQNFAFDILRSKYFDDFLRSSFYHKHIMDILTSGRVFLADIMYNDEAMFYFMEFMEQEGKSYLLAFWIAADAFREELQSKLNKKLYNSREALEDAMVLYDKYFSMQASNSLGVGDETRIRIENKICRDGGPLPECFEEPMENVLTLLEEVYFPIFLDSSIYMRYLNELLSSVTDVESDRTSICADECSSTTSDTMRMMESLGNEMDPLEDPNEIWQRPHVGLSIGRVNEFGIYEPGIEPQPGKEVLKFGQKMKKLVSGNTDKVKEEMAWKVAKMVISDVKKQQKK